MPNGKEARLLYLQHLKEKQQKEKKKTDVKKITSVKSKTRPELKQISIKAPLCGSEKQEAMSCIKIIKAIKVIYDPDYIVFWYNNKKYKVTIENIDEK